MGGDDVSTATQKDFERLMLPHLPSAYSLARWLLHHPQDAEDAVQEATLRAYKSFGTFGNGNARAWLLAIVRNTCLSMIQRRKSDSNVVVLQSVTGDRQPSPAEAVPDPSPSAESRLVLMEDQRRVHRAIAALPPQLREVLVLREFDELGYREIAEVTGTPIGTVMSRLARAREKLLELLSAEALVQIGKKDEPRGLR